MLLAGVEIRDGVHYQVKLVGVGLRGEGSKLAHWWNVGKLLIAISSKNKGPKSRGANQLGKQGYNFVGLGMGWRVSLDMKVIEYSRKFS